MSFNLHVVFSGPCLFVQHSTNKKQMAVLMPDARKRTAADQHLDDEPAEPHVGFIRINLADVRTTGLSIPLGDSEDEPKYEILHRFEREVLEFEGLTPEEITGDLDYPDLECFAPDLQLIPKLFSTDANDPPPGALLMRTVLNGGNFVSSPGTRAWRFSRLLAGNKPEYKKPFASSVCWERAVPGDRLIIRIRDFEATSETLVPLGPFTENETVTVEIANLCAYNPLEWKDLPVRKVMDSDEDFKWVYTLLTPDGTTWPAVLKGAPLPAPRLVRSSGPPLTGDDDCMGAQMEWDWPFETVTAQSSGTAQPTSES